MYMVIFDGDSLVQDEEICSKDKGTCLWFLVSVTVNFSPKLKVTMLVPVSAV